MYTNPQLSRLVTKPTKWHVRPWRLRSAWASAQSDQSSLSAWRKLVSLATYWAHSEDSDQTGRMPKLIWVFAGRTCQFVGFVTRRLNLFTCWRFGNRCCLLFWHRLDVFGTFRHSHGSWQREDRTTVKCVPPHHDWWPLPEVWCVSPPWSVWFSDLPPCL